MIDFIGDQIEAANHELRVRNDAFCATMMQAIEKGLERPPMIGVDTRPGTRNPKHVPHRMADPLVIRSVAGEIVGRAE